MKPRGIVLLEMLLYVALASILLALVASLYVLIVSAEGKQRARSEVEASARSALAVITQEIRDASAVSTPVQGESADTLVLSLPDSAVITLENGVLMLQEGGDPPLPLTGPGVAIENLSFENLSASDGIDSVRITFDAHFKNPGGRNDLEYADTYHASASTR